MNPLKIHKDDEDNCPAVLAAKELLQEVYSLSKDTNKKVDGMGNLLMKIENHVGHLPKLDSIAEELKMMNNNLIDAVTGKKQIPLISHLLIMAIMGAVILIVLMSSTNKSLSLSPTGITINEPQQHN